jgi:hypothetical protein
VDAEAEFSPEVRKANEDQGEQGFLVPGVVRQDVQVLKHLVSKSLSLVEQVLPTPGSPTTMVC